MNDTIWKELEATTAEVRRWWHCQGKKRRAKLDNMEELIHRGSAALECTRPNYNEKHLKIQQEAEAIYLRWVDHHAYRPNKYRIIPKRKSKLYR